MILALFISLKSLTYGKLLLTETNNVNIIIVIFPGNKEEL